MVGLVGNVIVYLVGLVGLDYKGTRGVIKPFGTGHLGLTEREIFKEDRQYPVNSLWEPGTCEHVVLVSF